MKAWREGLASAGSWLNMRRERCIICSHHHSGISSSRWCSSLPPLPTSFISPSVPPFSRTWRLLTLKNALLFKESKTEGRTRVLIHKSERWHVNSLHEEGQTEHSKLPSNTEEKLCCTSNCWYFSFFFYYLFFIKPARFHLLPFFYSHMKTQVCLFNNRDLLTCW